jgi:hypothetical protein
VNSQGRSAVKEELPTCQICGSYLSKGEGFQCPRCRRSPLCQKHKMSGMRECAGCVLEIKSKALRDMKSQEASLKSFLRLTQFAFLVFIILFVCSKTGIAEAVSFLKENMIMDNLGYLGGLSAGSYILFRVILYVQRARMDKLEAMINKIKKKELRRLA